MTTSKVARGARKGRGGRATGRPTKYTRELAGRICDLIADGKSLRVVCRRDDMPAARTVHRWLEDRTDFCQQYARAREAGADVFAEAALRAALGVPADATGAQVQAARLKWDALRWQASKQAPKRWGDKLEVAGDPERPLIEVPKTFKVVIAPPGWKAPKPER